jgi:hypothetical protein
MGWTTPKTWSVGSQATASDFNTYLIDNMIFLGYVPSGRCFRNSAWTPSAANAFEIVPYDTQDYVYNGMTFGSNELTVPVSGTYLVTGGVGFTTSTNNWQVNLNIYNNGVLASVGDEYTFFTGGAFPNVIVCDYVVVAASNPLAIYYYVSATTATGEVGGDLTYFAAAKVSN